MLCVGTRYVASSYALKWQKIHGGLSDAFSSQRIQGSDQAVSALAASLSARSAIKQKRQGLDQPLFTCLVHILSPCAINKIKDLQKCKLCDLLRPRNREDAENLYISFASSAVKKTYTQMDFPKICNASAVSTKKNQQTNC